jgi:hypothetical protein
VLSVLKEDDETAPIPVVMFSVNFELREKLHALQQGARDYITKPFSPRELLARIKAELPRDWFPDLSPIIDGMLSGLAAGAALIYSLIQYAAQQTRIKTATDGWLDMIAADFFGASLVRASNQSDASLKSQILLTLLRERATRAALVRVLNDLTGRAPIVVEPTRPADCGGYGLAGGYGVAGYYGSMATPYWCFVQVFRPATSGIPFVAGYGASSGGYGQASRAEYATLSDSQGASTDAAIYSAIESVRPAGVTVWACISS